MSDLGYPAFDHHGVIQPTTQHATEVVRYDNGWEQRARRLQAPITGFNITYEVLEDAEYRQILDFFVLHHGQAESFLFNDYTDDDPIVARSFGLGDGATLVFKLPIDAAAAITTYTGGVADNPQPTKSLTTGVVTYASAPLGGAVLTFSATTPRYRVRFASDQLTVDRMNPPGLWHGTVQLVQVKSA